MRAGTLFILFLVLVGCDPPSAPFRWQSEHFVYSSQSVPVFSEEQQIAAFEHHYASLSEAMGIELAPGDRIDFRQIDDVDVIRAYSGGFGGYYATYYDVVLSPDEFYGHELVHAYAARAGTSVPSFLEEGLAEALACVPDFGPDIAPDRAVATWLTQADTAARGAGEDEVARRYAVSGSFVAFVIARHGLRAFMSAYAELAGRQDVDAVFRERLGEGLEPMLDAWMAEGPIEASTGCAWIPECAADVETPDHPLELGFATRHYFGGGRPSAEGGEEIRVLALPEGRQRWTTRADTRMSVTLLPCTPAAPLPRPFVAFAGEQRTWVDLPGGTMAALFEVESREPATVSIEPMPGSAPFVADACGEDALVIDASDLTEERSEGFLATDAEACVEGCDLWVRIQTSQDVRITPSAAGPGGALAVPTQICDDACHCMELPRGQLMASVVVQPGTHWLELRVGVVSAEHTFVEVVLDLQPT